MGEATRRASRALLAFALGSLIAAPATASQGVLPGSRDGARIWSVEIGAVRGTPFVEDGNGVTVRGAIGPFAGGQVELRGGEAVSVIAGIRASTATIRVESTDREWDAGRTWRYDLRVGVETNAMRSVRLGGSAFAGVVTGPDDVIPFRRDGGRLALWGGELAAFFPLIRERHVDVLIGADAARLASQHGENPPLAGGWVGHVRVGVRHAFR